MNTYADESDKLRYFIRSERNVESFALGRPKQNFIHCGNDVCLEKEIYIEGYCVTYYLLPVYPEATRMFVNVKDIPARLIESITSANLDAYKRTYPQFFKYYIPEKLESFNNAKLVHIGKVLESKSNDYVVVRDILGVKPLNIHGSFLKEKVLDLTNIAIRMINEIHTSKLGILDKVEVFGNTVVEALDGFTNVLDSINKVQTVLSVFSEDDGNSKQN